MSKKSQMLARTKMYHPWKKDENGNRAVQLINSATVKSGKAALMGYLPVLEAQAPPPLPVEDFKIKIAKQPKTQI